tara:strand:+ start:482 stop:1204 length:723 start_codon:yes stop_codon:yes gene_type:complete
MIEKKTNYFDYSKELIVGIFFMLPFLFLYEIICFFYFKYEPYQIRNTADIIIHDLFNVFGQYQQFAYSISLLILVFIIYFYSKQSKVYFYINSRFLFLIAVEGLFFGIILILLINNINIFSLENYYQNSLILNIYLCFGAGIWEEVLFRLFLYNLILLFLMKMFSESTFFSYFFSILICSLLFSYFHYIGEGADVFTFSSFFFRFLGGVYLTVLYQLRGFGVTCMCHLSYDFILVSLPLI